MNTEKHKREDRKMRVTQMMRNHINTMVLAKVQDKLDAARAAAEKLKAERSAAIEAVKNYAESLLPELTKKVAAFAATKGLTWLDHEYSYDGAKLKSPNYAFEACVADSSNYVETARYGNYAKSAKRRADDEIRNRPQRISDAVKFAVDGICFDLELGKVKKAELEELIANCKVEL